ncbi:hypothetical protein L1887_20786 [Cichorium endivia]|nr:hypothetical protein L1887_20786 [Cichorium endivia]
MHEWEREWQIGNHKKCNKRTIYKRERKCDSVSSYTRRRTVNFSTTNHHRRWKSRDLNSNSCRFFLVLLK